MVHCLQKQQRCKVIQRECPLTVEPNRNIVAHDEKSKFLIFRRLKPYDGLTNVVIFFLKYFFERHRKNNNNKKKRLGPHVA